MANISPQGYSYGKDPKATNPFWDDKEVVFPEVSATATVDDTTGTPKVEVTKTGDDSAPVLAFSFSGIKGEKGAAGVQGPAGPEGPQGPQGERGEATEMIAEATVSDEYTGAVPPYCNVTREKYGDGYRYTFAFGGIIGPKGEQGPQGEQGPAPYISADATVDSTTGDPRVTVTSTESEDGKSFTYHFNFQGIKGEPGENGKDGETPTQYVKDLTITLTDNVLNFAITQGSGEVTQFPVTLSGGGSENGIVEVKDTVTQNNEERWDHHVFTETQDDGTENQIGEFYISQRQFLSVDRTSTSFIFRTISQSGGFSSQEAKVLFPQPNNFTYRDTPKRYTIGRSIDTSKIYLFQCVTRTVTTSGFMTHKDGKMVCEASGGTAYPSGVVIAAVVAEIIDGETVMSVTDGVQGVFSNVLGDRQTEVHLFTIDGEEIPLTAI